MRRPCAGDEAGCAVSVRRVAASYSSPMIFGLRRPPRDPSIRWKGGLGEHAAAGAYRSSSCATAPCHLRSRPAGVPPGSTAAAPCHLLSSSFPSLILQLSHLLSLIYAGHHGRRLVAPVWRIPTLSVAGDAASAQLSSGSAIPAPSQMLQRTVRSGSREAASQSFPSPRQQSRT